MSRFAECCAMGILLLAVVSCGWKQSRFSCFHNEAQDSVYVDLRDYVLPASTVTLHSAVKVCDKYYLNFCEKARSHRGGEKDILVELSEPAHKSRIIPLPGGVGGFSSVSSRNDTLVIRDRDSMEFVYDSKYGTWIKGKFQARPSYEDEEYIVRYEEHGEFGDAMWFIDKCSENQYAFVGLSGRVCRLGGVFYIVKPTRIYEVPEPSVGFHCDSLTNYAAAKGIHLLGHHFWKAGYCNDDHNILAIVHFDNEPAGMEERVAPNGVSYYEGGFWVSEYAKADTTIIGSFIESDTLYCALHTPSGLELAKLDQGRLNPVHAFNLDLGRNHLRYRYPSEYPAWIDVRRYCVCDNPHQERLLILVNRKEGLSELIDLSKDGNGFVNIVFDYSGLNPTDSDGFGTILPFYLENWGHMSFESVLRQENLLGGEVCHSDLGSTPTQNYYNGYPSGAIHHVRFSKEVRDVCFVTTDYSIKESDKSVTAVSIDWDCCQKYEDLSATISGMLGPGTSVPETGGKMQYMEWTLEKCTIRLYGSDYDVRFMCADNALP